MQSLFCLMQFQTVPVSMAIFRSRPYHADQRLSDKLLNWSMRNP